MTRIPRFGHRPLHGLRRRAGVLLRRHVLGRFVPRRRVRAVRIGGRLYKRLTLADTATAAGVVRALERFDEHGFLPALVAQRGNELVLEYVEGAELSPPFDDAAVRAVARLFGALYATDRELRATADTPFVPRLRRNLAFLRDVGVLAEGAWKDLDAAAGRRAPEAVHVGWDHLDALPRNFVWTPHGRLVAVDVEAVLPGQLLGGGLVKACLRGFGDHREALLDGVARAGVDLRPALPFVELDFLAGWTLQAYLKGRAKLVDPRLFEPHR